MGAIYHDKVDNNLSSDYVENGVRLFANRTLNIPSGGSINLSGLVNNSSSEDRPVISVSEGCFPKDVKVTASVNESVYCGACMVNLHLTNESEEAVSLSSENTLAELLCNSVEQSDVTFSSLVGPACETSVNVNGHNCQGLLDSGSQVTILSRSFYNDHLSANVPLHQLGSTLIVKGAGDQNVPYDGYVYIDMSFEKSVVGTDRPVQILALVCQDSSYSSRVPVIVGTNTFRKLAMLCKADHGPNFLTNLPIRAEVKYAYLDLTSDPDGQVGSVKFSYRHRPSVIPAGKTIELKGKCVYKAPPTRDSLLLHEDPSFPMPPGLNIVNCLVATTGYNQSVKVLVKNTTDHNISVYPRKIHAGLYVYESQTPIQDVYNNVHSYLQSATPPSDQSHIASEVDRNNVEFNFGDSPLSEVEKDRIKLKLSKYSDVFSQHEFDLGCTSAVEHDIKLLPGPTIRDRPRPIPSKDFEDARQHIQSLLDAGIIKPSYSPYASPVVLVRKKSGKLRLTIDYRKINARTIRDSYPIPKIEDMFAALSGSKWFCTMDLKMGFHQIPMAESSKDISAFVCPFGLFNFERMSQGLANSPLTFQRLMERCVGDMNMTELLVYLDDLIIYGATLEQAEERLFKTLDRLRAYGLKVDPKKCTFFVQVVKHLGHIVSPDGISPDPEKTSALTSWPEPTTLRELKSFLGFAGYYRRFVKDFSTIVRPLNKLSEGYIPLKSLRKMKTKPANVLNMSSKIDKKWDNNCQIAFDKIKQCLTSSPVLGYADLSSPFILHTDASLTGIGACLYQKQGDTVKVIAYASRGLNKSEMNYPAHKREFLALKWAVTDKFKDYLIVSKFTVVTDNNPLTYVMKSAKLDATGYRWLAGLSIFDFDIKYRRGINHIDADGLSRRPHAPVEMNPEQDETVLKVAWLTDRIIGPMDTEDVVDLPSLESISHEDMLAVANSHGVRVQSNSCKTHVCHVESPSTDNPDILFVETLTMNEKSIPDTLVDPPNYNVMKAFTNQDWSTIQRQDKHISDIIECCRNKRRPSNRDTMNAHPEFKIYRREFDRLHLISGVLYRVITDEKGMKWRQLVLPPSQRLTAMKGVHDDVGHCGYQSAIRLARQRFFWPFMPSSIEKHCKTCERCICRKSRGQTAAMESIQSTMPMDLVCIDFLSIEPDNKGIKDVLVITDHFTKYALAIPTRNQTAKVVAETLWENLICHYGWPRRLHSDQGRDFESRIISELCKMGGITKTRTTPYHPQGNPVERYNRTLLDMLGTLNDSQKSEWRKYVKPMTHAYNCRISESTGYSPYYLMFGRHPRLPVDVLFGLDPDCCRIANPTKYVSDLRHRLKYAFGLAQKSVRKGQDKNKRLYDNRAHATALEEGDRVLVRKMAFRGKHKLSDRWENEVYVVIKKRSNLPVYTIKRENGQGKERTLHRNLLLPCDCFPLVDHIASDPKPPQVIRQRETPDDVEEVIDDFHQDASVEFSEIPAIVVPLSQRRDTGLNVEAVEFVPQSEMRNSDVTPINDGEVETVIVDLSQESADDAVVDTSPESAEERGSDTASDAVDRPDSQTDPEDPYDLDETLVKGMISDCSSEDDDSMESDGAESPLVRRSARARQPPKRLTFDSLGLPSYSNVMCIVPSINTMSRT